MESIIVYAIILIFVWRIISKRKKNIDGDVNAARQRQAMMEKRQNMAGTRQSMAGTRQNMAGKSSGVHPSMPAKSTDLLKKDGKVSASLRDDRVNDWLANQMREEKNSLYRLREMFGFKMEGRNITDAELLKEFHLDHCDAGSIDRAQGK